MKNKFTSYRKRILASVLIVLISLTTIAVTRSDNYQEIARAQKLLNNVYKYLITNYADQINVDEFTRNSIRKMVDELDPYTVYMEAEERDNLDILTQGKYGGVGMQLGVRNKSLTVIAPMDDSPAQRAGIRSGDMIIAIDGELTEKMNIEDAAAKIRGQKGTRVELTIQRYGREESLKFSLVRADIRVEDVSYYGMLDGNIGYIRLTRFSKNSVPEVTTALKSLLARKPESIILDLRDNPGGLLNAAIDILDLFVPKGKLLLNTRGRIPESNRSYFSDKKPLVDPKIKVAVMINEGSASASEIVAGALQDLDRAIIVGESSFGKGLVQSVIQLDGTRSLKITTAKYYIPSGRLIQKHGYVSDKIVSGQDQLDTLFYTESGRRVNHGGGITPDSVFTAEMIGPLTQECYRENVFFNYVQSNQTRYKTIDQVLKDGKLMVDFAGYLQSLSLDVPLKGEKQYASLKTTLWEMDANNPDLADAFNKLDAFYQNQDKGLFDREKKDLETALLLEFAQSLGTNANRFEIALNRDSMVMTTRSLLTNSPVYSGMLTVKGNPRIGF